MVGNIAESEELSWVGKSVFCIVSALHLLAVLALSESGKLTYSLILSLLPFVGIFIVWILVLAKEPVRDLVVAFLSIQFFVAIMITSNVALLVLFSVVVLPFVIIRMWFDGMRFPVMTAVAYFLIGCACAVTLIAGVYQWRNVGRPFGQSDLQLVSILCMILVLYFMLSKGIVKVSSLLGSLYFSSILILGILYIQTFMADYTRSLRFGVFTSMNPNAISSQLDLIFPLSLAFLVARKSLSAKLVAGIFSGIIFLSIMFTYSRGSLPGIAMSFLAFVWVHRYNRRLVMLFAVLLLTGSAIFGPGIVTRLLSHNVNEMASNLGRMQLAQAAWSMIKSNSYIFGAGIDTFSSAKFQFGFPLYNDISRAMSSHNLYLEIWLGWGLGALVGWVLMVWGNAGLMIWHFFWSKFAKQNIELLAIGLALLGYSIHGLVDSTLAYWPITIQIGVLLACAMYLSSSPEASGRMNKVSP